MQQSHFYGPSSFPADQDITRLSRNARVHYSVHKSNSPLDFIPKQFIPQHSYFFVIHFNIIHLQLSLDIATGCSFRFFEYSPSFLRVLHAPPTSSPTQYADNNKLRNFIYFLSGPSILSNLNHRSPFQEVLASCEVASSQALKITVTPCCLV
jgi:hypothetical protein